MATNPETLDTSTIKTDQDLQRALNSPNQSILKQKFDTACVEVAALLQRLSQPLLTQGFITSKEDDDDSKAFVYDKAEDIVQTSTELTPFQLWILEILEKLKVNDALIKALKNKFQTHNQLLQHQQQNTLQQHLQNKFKVPALQSQATAKNAVQAVFSHDHTKLRKADSQKHRDEYNQNSSNFEVFDYPGTDRSPEQQYASAASIYDDTLSDLFLDREQDVRLPLLNMLNRLLHQRQSLEHHYGNQISSVENSSRLLCQMLQCAGAYSPSYGGCGMEAEEQYRRPAPYVVY